MIIQAEKNKTWRSDHDQTPFDDPVRPGPGHNWEHPPLLAVGGVVYSLGVIFYVCKRIPYNHAIWHGFVLGGSVCHFLAIYLYIGQV